MIWLGLFIYFGIIPYWIAAMADKYVIRRKGK